MGEKQELKIVILDGYTTNPGDMSWDPIGGLGQLEVYDWTDPDDVVVRLRDASAVFTNKVEINAAMMDQLPALKYIGIMATGIDGIDLEAANERGIIVTNVPEYASYSVAQLVFALVLELCYRIDMHHRSVTEERYWCQQPYNSYWLRPLVGLDGKILGVIGMGKIGQRVAEIGKAFGMNVLAYDVYIKETPNVTWVGLEELLCSSDVVSIHCPLSDDTREMINRRTLAKMRSTAFFINTSRGPLMVEQDLADALNNEVIAGAGLDVLNTEPPQPDNPLLTAKNVILTPHIGWATLNARNKLINKVADNYAAFLAGKAINVVNRGFGIR